MDLMQENTEHNINYFNHCSKSQSYEQVLPLLAWDVHRVKHGTEEGKGGSIISHYASVQLLQGCRFHEWVPHSAAHHTPEHISVFQHMQIP